MSHHGHRWDMDCVTRWASTSDRFAFMSQDVCDYLVRNTGKVLCHLVGQPGHELRSYGHLAREICLVKLECRLGISCVTLRV